MTRYNGVNIQTMKKYRNLFNCIKTVAWTVGDVFRVWIHGELIDYFLWSMIVCIHLYSWYWKLVLLRKICTDNNINFLYNCFNLQIRISILRYFFDLTKLLFWLVYTGELELEVLFRSILVMCPAQIFQSYFNLTCRLYICSSNHMSAFLIRSLFVCTFTALRNIISTHCLHIYWAIR